VSETIYECKTQEGRKAVNWLVVFQNSSVVRLIKNLGSRNEQEVKLVRFANSSNISDFDSKKVMRVQERFVFIENRKEVTSGPVIFVVNLSLRSSSGGRLPKQEEPRKSGISGLLRSLRKLVGAA